MPSIETKTTIILFGSTHLGVDTAPVYIDRYQEIIREINPDIICAELSPEQLAGTATCHSKPEYEAAVLPVARELNIPVVPIQMDNENGSKWEKDKNKTLEEMTATPQGEFYAQFNEVVSEAMVANLIKVLQTPEGIEIIQLRAYDLLMVEPEYAGMRRFFPDYMKLSDEWNRYFLDRIEETAAQNPGSRIMVIAGAFHKYWLWDELEKRSDIILHNLQSFRQNM
ncbi:MAG: hypothetical protein GY841_21960 [FCB group bacterium]|nr:hypothetical protein [FCB group bacterium]